MARSRTSLERLGWAALPILVIVIHLDILGRRWALIACPVAMKWHRGRTSQPGRSRPEDRRVAM